MTVPEHRTETSHEMSALMRARMVTATLAGLAAVPPGLYEAATNCGSERHPGARHATSAPKLVKGQRNKPCPCGSGKKFKHCCIGQEVGKDKPCS